jgi:hypothetical protein
MNSCPYDTAEFLLFSLRHFGARPFFPPLVKGGRGGVGTQAYVVANVFAVRLRLAKACVLHARHSYERRPAKRLRTILGGRAERQCIPARRDSHLRAEKLGSTRRNRHCWLPGFCCASGKTPHPPFGHSLPAAAGRGGRNPSIGINARRCQAHAFTAPASPSRSHARLLRQPAIDGVSTGPADPFLTRTVNDAATWPASPQRRCKEPGDILGAAFHHGGLVGSRPCNPLLGRTRARAGFRQVEADRAVGDEGRHERRRHLRLVHRHHAYQQGA